MTLRLKENIEQKNFLITQSPSHLITLKNVVLVFHPNKNNILNKALLESSRSLHTDMDSADLRTDGAKRVRVANRLSRLSRKAFRRNSVSVEQIQDTSYRPNVFLSSRNKCAMTWGVA